MQISAIYFYDIQYGCHPIYYVTNKNRNNIRPINKKKVADTRHGENIICRRHVHTYVCMYTYYMYTLRQLTAM